MRERSKLDFERRLHRAYGGFIACTLLFVLLMLVLERLGLSRQWLGMIFVVGSLLLYAGIGMRCRTSDPAEYYVAGRRVPALYNGMAAAADWMSVASYMGLAGTLYLTGFGGLAYVLGWTGGFCLVALLIAPYLRRFGKFTIIDFLSARYPGRLPRLVAAVSIVICSFAYVVAQIYGVGLITASLTGLDYQIGVFAGVSGVLLCSFLGGMRAVTWTQVAQCILMIGAYMVPVIWLSTQQTGSPLPQIAYGQQIDKVSAAERRLLTDPAELEVRRLLSERASEYADKLSQVPETLSRERLQALERLQRLRDEGAPHRELLTAERARELLPRSEAEARQQWTEARERMLRQSEPLAGMPPHALPFKGDPQGDAEARALFETDRRNFLALIFCLTLGTAALPHILARYYTTDTVAGARRSVAWTLFFILLLYLTAPALAVFIKYEVFAKLVGTPMSELPAWIGLWNKIDPQLISVSDVNGDGRLQLAELSMSGAILTLAMPAIAGLPYVVTCLVAAGGLAAALSTADGLLLTIANALSHDVRAPSQPQREAAHALKRVAVSKLLLMAIALVAAAIAVRKPGDILFLVSASFSLAASALFPALALAVTWRRASALGASIGMLVGLGVAVAYLTISHAPLRAWVGLEGPPELWFGILPVCAGVFGVPAGAATIVLVSLLRRDPEPQGAGLAEALRRPVPGE